MTNKNISLLPDDADAALKRLADMRRELSDEFDTASMEQEDYHSYAPDIASAYSDVLRTELELRRQMVLQARIDGKKKQPRKLG